MNKNNLTRRLLAYLPRCVVVFLAILGALFEHLTVVITSWLLVIIFPILVSLGLFDIVGLLDITNFESYKLTSENAASWLFGVWLFGLTVILAVLILIAAIRDKVFEKYRVVYKQIPKREKRKGK